MGCVSLSAGRVSLTATTGTLVVATAALSVACGSDSAVTATGPAPIKCQVAVAAVSATVAADGGSSTFRVTAAPECPWDASTSVPWLDGLSPASGQGDGTVAFRVAPNPTPSSREGDILVNDARLRIAQQAAPCRFDVEPRTLSVDAAGGVRDLAISAAAGCAWTATADRDWMTLPSPAASSGAGTVRLSVAPNPAVAMRSGTLVVANQPVVVTQAGTPAAGCTFGVALPAAISIEARAGVWTVAVSASTGCAWTAASTAPWLVITAGASGTGDGTVTFSAAENQGPARTGLVTIAGQTVTVTQTAAAPLPPCTYAISPNGVAVAANGGTGSIAVTTSASCGWTTTSGAAWLTLTSGSSGTGPGSVTFIAAANAGSARTGTLIIAGQTFTVTQAAAPAACSFTIAPTSASVPASGGGGTVAVSTSAGCAWAAVSNAPWLSITAGTSGSGNGTLAFTAATNAGNARTGTLTIAGQTFTITQAALVCTYTVSPTTLSISKKGGTLDVTVSAAPGCAWTARSTVAWIEVKSGANGIGNGSVEVKIDKNRDDGRTGTLTIAGQTVTIRQNADDGPES